MIAQINNFLDFIKNWDQLIHALNTNCKEKRTTGIFRTFSESKTCFQASKTEFYNKRFQRITESSFLPKEVLFLVQIQNKIPKQCKISILFRNTFALDSARECIIGKNQFPDNLCHKLQRILGNLANLKLFSVILILDF